jgi:hypothetical protein
MAAGFAALFGGGKLSQVLAASSSPRALPSSSAATHRQHHPAGPAGLDGRAALLTTALLLPRPRWWLGAGAVAWCRLGDNLLALLISLAAGILVSAHRSVAHEMKAGSR